MGKGDIEANQFLDYVFDAVLTIASAVNKTLQLISDPRLIEDFSYADGNTSNLLYEQLRNTSLQGATVGHCYTISWLNFSF